MNRKPSESLHSTLNVETTAKEHQQTAEVPAPLESSLPSLSPIPKPTVSVINQNANLSTKKRTPSESKLRKDIILDISTKMTSALQTALESLREDDSEDSFEHIESDSPDSPVMTRTRTRTNEKRD